MFDGLSLLSDVEAYQWRRVELWREGFEVANMGIMLSQLQNRLKRKAKQIRLPPTKKKKLSTAVYFQQCHADSEPIHRESLET